MSVQLTNAIGTTEEIGYELYGGGTVHVPNGSSVTSLTWWSASERGGTYEAAYDKDGNAVTQTVAADQAHPIPIALFGAAAIKAVANASGSVEVSLKA